MNKKIAFGWYGSIQTNKGQGAITYTHNPINQTESVNDPSQNKGNKVTVTGYISDDNIDRVEINGVTASITGDTFKAAVSLTAGNNTVTATAYDKAGNSTTTQISLILDTTSTSRFVYDANGNMTQRTELGKTTLYTYDYENRLTSLSSPQSFSGDLGTTVTYTYDPLGRRIRKSQDTSHTSQVANYIYDGNNIIAEYDSNNNLVKKNVFGPGIDEILYTISYTPSANYYYHKDALGSITNITSSTGSIVESCSYDAYGNVTIKNATGTNISQSAIGNRYMFTGREYDAETGLYYYRNRYYDPTLGRFITQDPSGISDDINLYAYCFNNPINFVDPLGLGKDRIQVGFNLIPWTPIFHTGIRVISSEYGARSWGFNPEKFSFGALLGKTVRGKIYINEPYNFYITVSKNPDAASSLYQNLKAKEKLPAPNYDLLGKGVYNCYSWRDEQIRKEGISIGSWQ